MNRTPHCDATDCPHRAEFTLTVIYSDRRHVRDFCAEHEREYYAAAMQSRFVQSAWRKLIRHRSAA